MTNAHIDQYLVSNPNANDITIDSNTENQLVDTEINNDKPVEDQQIKTKQR